MKIGILQVDSVREEFQTEFGNYPDMFRELLQKASNSVLEEDLEICNFDVEYGEYPASPSDCDGYVITGSKRSVYEDEAWITRFRDYIKELHKAKIKMVGICFGHQMLALALGGRSEKADAGWGVGVHSYDVLIKKPYMQPPLANVSALVSHQDQVLELPAGAERLGGSKFCPNSMFQIEDHVLGFQGHPEFSKAYSEALMNLRREILGEEVYKKGMESLQRTIEGDTISQWMLRFLAG